MRLQRGVLTVDKPMDVMAQSIPEIPPAWPKMGNCGTRWFGRAILRLSGWQLRGDLPARPPLIIAGAPHTSNWDFVFGMAAMLALGIRIQWLGKHTIFKRPFRRLLINLGGIPVDRAAAAGVVPQAVQQFRAQPDTVLALAPEGTRARVENWKTGFLRIANAADVPVLPIGIDYRTRTFYIGRCFKTSGDHERDLAELKRYFARSSGKHPHLAG